MLPKKLPINEELIAVAKSVNWYMTPQEVLRDVPLFVAQVLDHGLVRDVLALRRHLTDDQLREAIRNAPPGIFHKKSWNFWHIMLDMGEVPQLPKRILTNLY